MRSSDASSLKALLESHRETLRTQFTLRRESPVRRRVALLGPLLQGLELLWKIEEQVLLPALQAAAAGTSASAVRQADDELDLMRDLAMLAPKTKGSQREVTLAVLEGMAVLHFARVAELMDKAPAGAADWAVLEEEVRGLLGRWRSEVHGRGEIEDEDRDPVGLRPR